MVESTRELLTDVINNRLAETSEHFEGVESTKSFEEAMSALDRQIKMDELDITQDKNIRDDVAVREKNKKDRIIQIAGLAAGVILTPILDFAFKRAFSRDICEFEKNYDFTTSAGKSLSSLFRFKK